MIVDTSAIMAILKFEPEAENFLIKLESARKPRLAAGSYIEICAVIVRSGIADGFANFDRLMATLGVEVVATDPVAARIARTAYATYGRGTTHPAQLNFGDCFAYALAKATGEPLLFKGDDFTQTDIAAA